MFKKSNKTLKNKRASGAVGTAIAILSSVVAGAIVLMGSVGVVNTIVKPKVNAKVDSMYATETAGGGSGGGGGVIIEPEELKIDTLPETATYKSESGTVKTDFSNVETGDVLTYGDYKYTYNEDGKWSAKVKDTTKTEYGEIAAEIAGKPVTSMAFAFYQCASLIAAPVIPNSVTNLGNTFEGCKSLTVAPTIPNSVTIMNGTFLNCTSLISAPTIPSGVTGMAGTFSGCTSLKGDIKIDANPSTYYICLKGTKITNITGACTNKEAILATK